MKKTILILLGLFLLTPIIFAQSKSKVAKPKSSFTKMLTSDGKKYVMEDNVMVTNGKGDKIKVHVILSVDKQIWDHSAFNEREYLEYVANEINDDAKRSAKNELSFEPLSNNNIYYENGVYTSNYKMMARNGYGNLVEGTVTANFRPHGY